MILMRLKMFNFFKRLHIFSPFGAFYLKKIFFMFLYQGLFLRVHLAPFLIFF